MNEKYLEDYTILKDIIDECYNGRTEGHKCPFCGKGDLLCEVDEERIRIECPNCGKWFEGYLQ